MKLLIACLLLLCPIVVCAQIPTAPSSLSCANGSGNNINLTWSDNSSNETGFKVERKLGVSGTFAQIDTTAAGITTYADSSAKIANRPYIYRVRAFNGSGDSAYSNEDDATTPYLGTVPNYRTDSATYPETPTTMPLPLAGGKFYDETFGSLVMRFTDESDGLSFGTNYSVWPTANCDNTKLFLYNFQNNSYHIGTLNPTTYTRTGALQSVASPPATIFSHMESAFWSFSDPDKLYVLVDAKIYFYRPSTNTFTLVKSLTSSFPAGYFFLQLYVSNDDNRFAAMMRNGSGNQGFMVWEQSTDSLKLDVRVTDVNGITMDRSGVYVLYVPDTDPNQYIYNANTGTHDTLVSNPSTGLPDFNVGHNDTGVNQLVGDDQWNGGTTWRRMSTPHTVVLAWQYAPFWINYHVSGLASNDNWNIISTYGNVSVSADSAKYRQEVIQLAVANQTLPSIRRLVHNRAVWVQGGSKTISAASNTTPIVITTTTAHGFQTGQRLQISGVGGNTAANGLKYITVINATQASLNGTTGNGSYTSGGNAFLETYWDSPRANISRDGQFIFWTSNWNGVPGGGRTDLFIVQIVPPVTGRTISGKATLSGKVSW